MHLIFKVSERELKALQLQKTHANRKSTSKIKKTSSSIWQQALQILTTQTNKETRCKCLQHNQIKLFICRAFLWFAVLWAFAAHMLSNWWSSFLNLKAFFFFFAVHWALSATIDFLEKKETRKEHLILIAFNGVCDAFSKNMQCNRCVCLRCPKMIVSGEQSEGKLCLKIKLLGL